MIRFFLNNFSFLSDFITNFLSFALWLKTFLVEKFHQHFQMFLKSSWIKKNKPGNCEVERKKREKKKTLDV